MTAKVWQHSKKVVVLFKAELATSHMKHGSVCKRNQSLRKSSNCGKQEFGLHEVNLLGMTSHHYMFRL